MQKHKLKESVPGRMTLQEVLKMALRLRGKVNRWKPG